MSARIVKRDAGEQQIDAIEITTESLFGSIRSGLKKTFSDENIEVSSEKTTKWIVTWLHLSFKLIELTFRKRRISWATLVRKWRMDQLQLSLASRLESRTFWRKTSRPLSHPFQLQHLRIAFYLLFLSRYFAICILILIDPMTCFFTDSLEIASMFANKNKMKWIMIKFIHVFF